MTPFLILFLMSVILIFFLLCLYNVYQILIFCFAIAFKLHYFCFYISTSSLFLYICILIIKITFTIIFHVLNILIHCPSNNNQLFQY